MNQKYGSNCHGGVTLRAQKSQKQLKNAKNWHFSRQFGEYCFITPDQNRILPCFIDYDASPSKMNNKYGSNCHRGVTIRAQKSQKQLKNAKNWHFSRQFGEYCLITQDQNRNLPCFIDYDASPSKMNHKYGSNCHRGVSIRAQKSQKQLKTLKIGIFSRQFGEYCLRGVSIWAQIHKNKWR